MADDNDRDDTGEGARPGDKRASRLSRLGRRLMQGGDDVKELAATVWETSDRAKSEMVRMVAREVRNYLDELKLKDDLLELATSHSLELKVSIHLKPLTPEPPAPPPAPAADEVGEE